MHPDRQGATGNAGNRRATGTGGVQGACRGKFVIGRRALRPRYEELLYPRRRSLGRRAHWSDLKLAFEMVTVEVSKQVILAHGQKLSAKEFHSSSENFCLLRMRGAFKLPSKLD